MAVTVVQETRITGWNLANGTTMTLNNAPQAGDVLVIAATSGAYAGRPVEASGCGAAWTSYDSVGTLLGLSVGTAGIADVYFMHGVNPTSAGTITLTFYSSPGKTATTTFAGSITLYHLRGVANPGSIAVLATSTGATATTTPLTGPSQDAQDGQFVITAKGSSSGATTDNPAWASTTPAAGWTSEALWRDISYGQASASYRVPTEATATAHRRDLAAPGSAQKYSVGQAVIGSSTPTEVTGTLAATAPGRTASLAGTHTAAPVTGTLSGMAPGRSGSFTGELAGAVTGTLAGTAPGRSADLAGSVAGPAPVTVGTDSTNAANLVQVSGIGYVESNPPIVPTPSTLQRGHDYIKAIAYTRPTMDNGRAVDLDAHKVEAEVKAHRDRIIVGGRDVTYFRGAQTPFPGYPLMQPFAYGATRLAFPQTNAAFERAGEGALAWLDEEKRVRFQRVDVDTGAVVGTDYRGFIEAISTEVHEGRLIWVADVGGDLSGRASMREQQPRLFRWVRDIARHVHDNVQSLNLRVKDIPDIGIPLEKQGGMSQLDWLQQLCAMAVKKDGTAYTLMPSADNERVWDFQPKDTTTKHATVYFDGANVVPDLKRDLHERANKIFMRGTTPEGMKVRNGRYPGLLQANAPTYPFTGSVGVGEVSGGDVEVMNWRLIGAKYLDDRDHVAQFTDDTADAIERLQEDAGLPQTGRMDSATWDALFDLTVTGYNLRQIGVEPMAQADYVRKWNRTGSGARASRNPEYDPTRLEVHQTFDVGTGHKISTMFRWARRKRVSMLGKNWVGQIQVNIRGVIQGEHNPGDPLTADRVMPVRALRPGMNLWAPLWDGGTLLHIAGIDVSPDGRSATLTVDTKYRDMLEAWEIKERNRESRRDPARSFFNQFRKRNMSDAPLDFDEVGGLLPDTITCPANQWTVVPIVGGLGGTVRKISVQTSTPATYALSVWGKDPDEKNLDLTIPAPLALDADGEPVWSQNLPIFDNRILLGAWGDEKQPCGYAPGRHTNDSGNATNDPVTGLFEDEGGFSYYTDKYPVLYVAIWPTSATTIKPQRIMWPQLEEGQ